MKDCLFNEETRRRDTGKENTQALVIEIGGRDSKGYGKSKSQSKRKDQIKCFFCDKKGHIKKHCKAWKNKQKENQNQNTDQNVVASVLDEDVAIAVMSAEEQ